MVYYVPILPRFHLHTNVEGKIENIPQTEGDYILYTLMF
uniref:Uncharacterized protein n=1 Tax=Physcomitrium patens TaxID=3218 RepID=A0A2K1II80_PHYPA|nr:hypothetical protein PHYPA_027678 [Physcomitrium patens]